MAKIEMTRDQWDKLLSRIYISENDRLAVIDLAIEKNISGLFARIIIQGNEILGWMDKMNKEDEELLDSIEKIKYFNNRGEK